MSSKMKTEIKVLRKEGNIYIDWCPVCGNFVVDMCWNDTLNTFRRIVVIKKYASTYGWTYNVV